MPPDELMRLLIPPVQALELTLQGMAAEALANATRRFDALKRDRLDHLTSNGILTALAELDLRGRQLDPALVNRVRQTHDEVKDARRALADAEANHARAKADVFSALGSRLPRASQHASHQDRRGVHAAVTKHVLAETNYCATMYEHRPVEGRFRCTAAGRYMDTDGRVICERCAAGLVVVKLTDLPKLLDLVDRLADLKMPLAEDLRALVACAPRKVPP